MPSIKTPSGYNIERELSTPCVIVNARNSFFLPSSRRTSHIIRHPDVRRDPDFPLVCRLKAWVPAFAGMTEVREALAFAEASRTGRRDDGRRGSVPPSPRLRRTGRRVRFRGPRPKAGVSTEGLKLLRCRGRRGSGRSRVRRCRCRSCRLLRCGGGRSRGFCRSLTSKPAGSPTDYGHCDDDDDYANDNVPVFHGTLSCPDSRAAHIS